MRLAYSDQARDDLISLYADGVRRFGEAQADRSLAEVRAGRLDAKLL